MGDNGVIPATKEAIMAKQITPKNPATKATTAKTDSAAERKTSAVKFRGRKSARKTSTMKARG